MPNDKRFNFRLPENLFATIENRAKKHSRTVTSEMIVLIKLGLVNETNESAALTNAEKIVTQNPPLMHKPVKHLQDEVNFA